ncbi:MAG: T9SS C-terminal target domain-containing protein [Bacteroidetes bacterium]|nr:MAG: T9SS C-terminal target domain-containing protein [Bacteroidota bacterium]
MLTTKRLGSNPISSSLVYPNPARETVHLSFYLDRPQQLRWQWLTAQGQVLETQRVQAGEGPQTLSLAISAYPPGVYFARLLIDGRAVHRKVVVGQ